MCHIQAHHMRECQHQDCQPQQRVFQLRWSLACKYDVIGSFAEADIWLSRLQRHERYVLIHLTDDSKALVAR